MFSYLKRLFSKLLFRKESICIIYFYEWSDILSSPLVFNSRELFLEFLNSCGISYSDSQLSMIMCGGSLYGSCVRGSGELLLFKNYLDLRNKLIVD